MPRSYETFGKAREDRQRDIRVKFVFFLKRGNRLIRRFEQGREKYISLRRFGIRPRSRYRGIRVICRKQEERTWANPKQY